MDIRDIRCTTCFAPLNAELSSENVVTCKYCRTPMKVAGIGGVLLQLTAAEPHLPGWNQHLYDPPRWSPGPPPELAADIPGEGMSWDVVRSVATFDDFDVTATLRLSRGDLDTTHGGLKFRRDARGLYQLGVSTNGKFALHYLPIEGPHIALAAWTVHPAVRSVKGEPDTLRVLCVGDRIRAFINGTSVASVRDGSSAFGSLGLFAQSGPAMAIACTSIVVREPQPEAHPPDAPPDAQQAAGAMFDLVLVAPAPSHVKIQSIKVVKEATGLGLKESKDLVEAGGPIQLGQPRAALERIFADLEQLGCKVEIRPSRR